MHRPFAIVFLSSQYPAIFVICFFLAVFGLLQPHKSLFANILEMVLSADVLIMLLFRNTDHLQEIYQVCLSVCLSVCCLPPALLYQSVCLFPASVNQCLKFKNAHTTIRTILLSVKIFPIYTFWLSSDVALLHSFL